jgi:hypothetical protein
MTDATAWSIWGGFIALFVIQLGIIVKVITWEGSVMARIQLDEKDTRSVSDRLIGIETVCKKCPIEEVESCQIVLKSRITALEINHVNIAQAIGEIKIILERMDKKWETVYGPKNGNHK